MRVHLTFDVEVWCDGWSDLDARFPAAYERYVYGRSAAGDYALPKTLDILGRNGLKGVFFVEPLFSARFGAEYLQHIVRMIEDAGHEVQLHLHPEWTDELKAPPIADAGRKRQHLCHYTREEQEALLRYALSLLQTHARTAISSFRAGSYAVNRDTYAALGAVGLTVDSSLNQVHAISGADVDERGSQGSTLHLHGIQVHPVSVFRDGLGRLRPAQVNACGMSEFRHALDDAHAAGRGHFVIVSHNFELLKPDRSEPDRIAVRRFEALCRHLASEPDRFQVSGFQAGTSQADREVRMLSVPAWSTALRLGAQVARRWG
jgi:hypothetical protein